MTILDKLQEVMGRHGKESAEHMRMQAMLDKAMGRVRGEILSISLSSHKDTTLSVMFDCSHLGDCPDTEATDKAFGDSSEAHLTGFFSYGGAIRSALFVEKECIGIIDQLVEKEKEGNKK